MPSSTERVPDGRDLPVEAVYELGAVAARDSQFGRPEQRPVDLDLSRVRLGVNHKHTRGCDRDVIDVSAAPGHAAIVKNDRGALSGSPIERFADRNLAKFARSERGLVRRCVLEPKQESADVTVCATDV
jgi:hypothetical protein